MGGSEGCFEALRIPLVRGRLFGPDERESVAIVNESMAEALWPNGEDPIVAEATSSRRFVLVLLAGFAALAIALCAVGIYGMLGHLVGQRSREIGIRLALGARRAHVVSTIVGHVFIGVLAGVAAGLLGARMLAFVIATQLFEVSATDLGIYLGVVAFVGVVATLACWPPTRRAVRVDPVVTLRAD